MTRKQAKAFKRFGSAVKYADEIGSDYILKAGEFYIVQPTKSYTEFAVLKREQRKHISGDFEHWPYKGHVTRNHLMRLNNANWAKPGTPGKGTPAV